MASQHYILKFSISSVFIMSTWCLTSGEPFWPCGHKVNASQSINLEEILGQWLIVASMDDMSYKSGLRRCDKVTISEVNATHLMMSEYNQFNQHNMTIHIQDARKPGEWELPGINGAAMIIDLDPGISFTMAVCYRTLNFWWLAVLVPKHIVDNVDDSISTEALSSTENELNISHTEKPLSVTLENIIKNVGDRLLEYGINLEEASVIDKSQC